MGDVTLQDKSCLLSRCVGTARLPSCEAERAKSHRGRESPTRRAEQVIGQVLDKTEGAMAIVADSFAKARASILSVKLVVRVLEQNVKEAPRWH